ncbi:precorrin-3B synthase [Rhodococcoides fascians]|uniref:precorrin-3B synthase n=1 Tax=Rhodococcoides fascians TaxID=1828 RepID=UPI000AE96940|nr:MULTISPECIES: precorrin-3B synthase [Rhodococcus]
MSSTDPRAVPDKCPGALSMHQAADGSLARVRLPGGVVTPAQMLVLSGAATELGNGSMELTSRGNVQFRAVSDGDELARRLSDAGLLPSPTHERVRNILASPLTGRVGGIADVRDSIGRLDAALCARPALAELPGRTLFALDDGRGDVLSARPDFAAAAVSPEHHLSGDPADERARYALVLAGRDTGVRIAEGDVVDVLLASAQAFVDLRTSEWRLSELYDGPERVLAALGSTPTTESRLEVGTSSTPPVGWLPQNDGRVALGGALALGTLDGRLAEFLAAIDRPLVLTPWRSVVVCDLDEDMADTVVRVLAPMGLIFDENSPWIDASACTGSPGCEKSNADVRADLTDAIGAGTVLRGRRQHWSGCDRRCGAPKGDVLNVVAGPTGYRVS